MKKFLAAIIASILCLCAVLSAACQDNTPVQTPVEPQPDNNVQEVSAELRTAITTEGNLSEFEVVYVYGNDEIENYIFWCDADITDFYIVALDGNAEDWTTNGVRLFELSSLKSNEAVNYKCMVPEGFPAHAVIYTANDQTYRYAISYNGRDGGISLIEIEKLFVVAEGEKETTTTATTTTTEKTTTTTTTTTKASTEVMACIYWVSEDLYVFPREMTIESDSKWHVWKALKQLNENIPIDCSLISGDMLLGRDGIMVLNFSKEFEAVTTSMTGRLTLEAIANTYVEFCGLNAVRFQIEGEYFESAICGYAEEIGYTEY